MLSARSTALRTRVVPAFQGLERLAGTRRGALVLVGAAVVAEGVPTDETTAEANTRALSAGRTTPPPGSWPAS